MKRYAIALGLAVFAVFAFFLIAHAASSGPNFSSIQSNDNPGTTFDSPWSNIANLAAQDGVYATSALNGSGAPTTYWADTSGYGFSIPAGSTINGIVVQITRKTSSITPFPTDSVVQLIKGGTATGNNKADSVTAYTTSDVTISYGSAADLWGLALTSSDINASNFGVRYQAQAQNLGTCTISADSIRITVTYTLPASGPHAQLTQTSGTMTLTSGTLIIP